MGEVFVGSEAVACGQVTRHELQRWYRPMYPNVHAPSGRPLSIRDRTVGAWLWSKRGGIVTGVAASALHGAHWIDDDVDVELIWNCTRPPKGVVVRHERIADDEITCVGELPVATVVRTAFDLGRFLARDKAIARLDALMWATPFSIEDVLLLAKRYKGGRGVKRLRECLPDVDGGAASPRETRLRLTLIDGGLPRPATQIRVADERGMPVRVLDMGWEDYLVAVEYDGDQHRTDRTQYVKDMRVLRVLEQLGWIVIRVIKEDRDYEVVDRVRKALISRGWRP
jgi:hypothetical protein